MAAATFRRCNRCKPQFSTKSLTGPWIKQNLGFLLIKPTEPEDKQLHQKEAVLP
jgi:methylphosphotriester-DNA--protein-cysteine methyltransferase